MATKKPFAVLPMIGDAWEFFWKQPALLPVALFLIGIPNFCISTLSRLIEPQGALIQSDAAEFLRMYDQTNFSIALGAFLLFLITLWGVGGVLVVGRRMIGARSGRARTSFSSVAKEGADYIRSMFFTGMMALIEVLVWCLLAIAVVAVIFHFGWLTPRSGTVLWAFAILFLPAFYAAIRLSFAVLAVVCEEPIAYRAALRRSKELVRGKFWIVTGCILVFIVCSTVPVLALSYVTETSFTNLWLLLGSDFILQLINAVLSSLFLLTMVILYGKLRDAPKEVQL